MLRTSMELLSPSRYPHPMSSLHPFTDTHQSLSALQQALMQRLTYSSGDSL